MNSWSSYNTPGYHYDTNSQQYMQNWYQPSPVYHQPFYHQNGPPRPPPKVSSHVKPKSIIGPTLPWNIPKIQQSAAKIAMLTTKMPKPKKDGEALNMPSDGSGIKFTRGKEQSLLEQKVNLTPALHQNPNSQQSEQGTFSIRGLLD